MDQEGEVPRALHIAGVWCVRGAQGPQGAPSPSRGHTDRRCVCLPREAWMPCRCGPASAHLGGPRGGGGAEPGRSQGRGRGRLESKTLTPKTMSSPRLRQLIWSRPRFIKFS